MAYCKDALCANIRAERARLDLSQEELAQRAGLSAVSIQKYENGDMTPGVDKLAALADVFGTTPNALLGWLD